MTTTTERKRTRTVYDCKHVKIVTAWVLLSGGKMVGRIVADYSDNPNGAVCTATVTAWAGPLADKSNMTGRAGGGGYCKFSAAVDEALRKGGLKPGDMHGAGKGAVIKYMESLGYVVLEVI